MPILKRIFYVCGMAGITLGLLIPLDLALGLGWFEFFASPKVFLLAIPYWFLAPWMASVIPYDNDDE